MSQKQTEKKATKRVPKPTRKELMKKAKGMVREAEKDPQDRVVAGFSPIWIERRSKKDPQKLETFNIFLMQHPDWRNFVFDMFKQHEDAVKHLQDQLMVTTRQINLVMERVFLPTPDEVTFRGHKLELVLDALKDYRNNFEDDDIAVYRLDEMINDIEERLKEAKEQVERILERNKPEKKAE